MEDNSFLLYYMRDNHTFKKLSNVLEDAKHQIKTELESGYTYGTVFSRSIREVLHHKGETTDIFLEKFKKFYNKNVNSQV